MRNLLSVFFIISLIGTTCINKRENDDTIIGVKIYEQQTNYESLFTEWKAIGINTAFISVDLAYDKTFRHLARQNKVLVFIILPIFFNPQTLQEHPDWYAITEAGNHAKDEWVEFVSPSNELYRSQKVDFIEKVVKDTEPDGISIDFIRYFTYWEKIYEDRTLASLTNTSFDSLSLTAFQIKKGVTIPLDIQEPSAKARWILANHEELWTSWKCENIVSIVRTIVNSAKTIQPDLQVNLHMVPWREHDFDGAIKKIAGQDLPALAQFTDYISPMCYSHMLKRDANWVTSVVKDMSKQSMGKTILPSIQVKEAYLTDVLTLGEFEKNLEAALTPPSQGVIFWSWAHLEQDPEKKLIIKKWAQR